MITGIVYRLGHHGWGEITLVTDEGAFEIQISYITEPLVSLFDAITAVWTGEVEAVVFDGEGPIYYLRLTLESATMMRVEFYENVALEEYDFESEDPYDELPTPQYACSMPLVELAFIVAKTAEGVLKEFGLVKYKKRWMRPFPLRQYNAFKDLTGYR